MLENEDCRVVLVRIDRAAVRHTQHPRHLFPALDLKYVQAGLASQGIRAELIDGWLAPFQAERCAEEIIAMRPRIAVLKGVSWCLEETIATGRRLRQAGITTIAVGQAVQHAAVQPPPGWDEAFDHALAGEPEAALPALVAALLQGRAAPPAAPPRTTASGRITRPAADAAIHGAGAGGVSVPVSHARRHTCALGLRAHRLGLSAALPALHQHCSQECRPAAARAFGGPGA